MTLLNLPLLRIFRKIPFRPGFWLGIFLFVFVLVVPISSHLTGIEKNMLAVALLMAAWWMTEALPLAVTSLVPLALYPFLGIMKTSEVSPNYTNHLVFLFMGGFIIAIALQEWQLHRRFALHTIAFLGNNPRRVVLAFMLSSAILSMWISNTATAIMMLPIALAVVHQVQGASEETESKNKNFGAVLMLGIAYSASIGGMATLIGTPPNVVFSGIYGKYFPDRPEISFLEWMIKILPLAIIIFTLLWLYLVHFVLKKEDLPAMKDKKIFREEMRQLGPMNANQRRVLAVFVLTAFLWIFRANIDLGFMRIPGWAQLIGLGGKIQDSTVAIGMAILLFIIPVKGAEDKKTLLNWKSLLELPWDILLLFGGGFALADGIQKTGLADFLGQRLEFLGNMHMLLMLFILTLSVALLTEFTSNTAVATTILPVMAALAIDLQINPIIIMLPATIAASCAFMLPVSTPPNAIVFGSRYITIQKMVRVGIVLILLVSMVVSLYFYLFFHIFGS